MFGFKKNTAPEMNSEAAAEFWSWFEEKEAWIIECLSESDAGFVYALDEKLKPVFPYVRRELEFQLGYSDGQGECFFFHFGDGKLEADAEKLAEMMPAGLSERWKFIAEI